MGVLPIGCLEVLPKDFKRNVHPHPSGYQSRVSQRYMYGFTVACLCPKTSELVKLVRLR